MNSFNERVLRNNLKIYRRKYGKKCLKDQDFEFMKRQNMISINLFADDIKVIISTLKRDSEFLRLQGIMDYSLLLGIEEIN